MKATVDQNVLSDGCARPCVLIYTHSLLDRSMTFIKSHANALRRHEAFYVGSHVSRPGLELPLGRYAVANSGGLLGLFREFMFRRHAYAPVLFRRLLAEKPLLVHAHFGTSGAAGLAIAEHLRIPLVVTFHGKDASMTAREAASTRRGREYLRHRRRMIEGCHCVIAVSEFIRSKVVAQGFHPDRVVVHRNGIDTNFFQPIPVEREPIILFVGRFVEKKGTTYLLKAVSILRSRKIKAKVVLIGDGPQRRELERLAQEERLDAVFTGFLGLNDVKSWLNRAMIVAVPSITASNGDSEGLPTVVLEAQAMSTPVVATRHSGIPEGVIDGETALLVDEREVESLADALSALLSDPDKARRLGEAGRAFVLQKFNLATQVSGLEDIYEDVRART